MRALAVAAAVLISIGVAGTSTASAAESEAPIPFFDCYTPLDASNDLVHYGALDVEPQSTGTAGTTLTNTNFYDFMSIQDQVDPTPNFFSSGPYFPPTTFRPGITHLELTIATDASTTWLIGDWTLTIDPSTFTAADLCPTGPQGPAGAQGPQGERGPPGEPGVGGLVNVSSPTPLTVRAKARRVLSIDCPAGRTAISGGWNLVSPKSGKPPAELGSFPGGSGWSEQIENRSSRRISVNLYAVCATS